MAEILDSLPPSFVDGAKSKMVEYAVHKSSNDVHLSTGFSLELAALWKLYKNCE
jgi:hypothetical protein